MTPAIAMSFISLLAVAGFTWANETQRRMLRQQRAELRELRERLGATWSCPAALDVPCPANRAIAPGLTVEDLWGQL